MPYAPRIHSIGKFAVLPKEVVCHLAYTGDKGKTILFYHIGDQNPI